MAGLYQPRHVEALVLTCEMAQDRAVWRSKLEAVTCYGREKLVEMMHDDELFKDGNPFSNTGVQGAVHP